MNEDLFKTVLAKSMALCSRREMCTRDMHDKAVQWGLGAADSDKLIGILVKEKFIDEIRYAKAYANDRFNYAGWGKIKISAGLRMKGLSSENIKEAMENIDENSYKKKLQNLISNRKKYIKAGNNFEMKTRLFRFALSRGFESDLVYEILGGNDLSE